MQEQKNIRRDDIRRQIRITQIDAMLRGGNFIKIEDLVFKFGVNKRTIERDFERLRDELNAPLEYDKSSNMYHYTDSTFSVPNVLLTEGELFTVATIMPLMEQYKNTPLEDSFKNIMNKISSFLPDKVNVDSSFLNKDVSFISDPLPKIETEVFNSIFKAIRTQKVIKFNYKSTGSAVFREKILNPYHVLCQKGAWYVFGFDCLANDFRVLAMARIKDIEFTGESFKIQKDFDINKHVDLNFGIWNNPNPPVEYELLFIPRMANYILEREWHKNQVVEQKEDGSILLKFKSNQKQMIFSWVLSFGAAVKVLSPKDLQDEVKKECLKVVEEYKKF